MVVSYNSSKILPCQCEISLTILLNKRKFLKPKFFIVGAIAYICGSSLEIIIKTPEP